MKKSLYCILCMLVGVLLCSCSFNVMIAADNDQNTTNQKFEEILEAVQSENKDMLTSLFSSTALKNAEMFDASVDELFDYFNGELRSYDDWGGPVVDTERNYDQVFQTMEATYDVKTTEDAYRITFRYITDDTANSDNVGIQSLYIIRAGDDSSPQYAYWGDRQYTPGINIGVPNKAE